MGTKEDANRRGWIIKLKNLESSDRPLENKAIATAALLLDDRLSQIQALLEAIAAKRK